MNAGGYMECVENTIKAYPIGKPIQMKELAATVAAEFDIPLQQAHKATAVTVKRLFDQNRVPGLCRYEKGIYYLAEDTPFGKTGINREQVIALKYTDLYDGYESGEGMLHKLGLTTLMPNTREIVTNKALSGTRKDQALGIILKKPPTPVNEGNLRYLQLLDMVAGFDRAPVDSEQPYQILLRYMHRFALQYDRLLALGYRHYTEKTVARLARLASEEVEAI